MGKKGVSPHLTSSATRKRTADGSYGRVSSIPTPPPPSAAFLLDAGELIALEDTQMRLPERQMDAPWT